MVFLKRWPFLFVPMAMLIGLYFFRVGTLTFDWSGIWAGFFTLSLGISVFIYGASVLMHPDVYGQESAFSKIGAVLLPTGVVLFLAGCIFSGELISNEREERAKPFEAAFAQTVLTHCSVKPTMIHNGRDRLYVFDEKGKSRGNTIVPEKYMANAPEDIDGIIIVQASERKVAYYTGTGQGVYHVDYNIKILDPYECIIINENYFPFQGDKGECTGGSMSGSYCYPDENVVKAWVEKEWDGHLKKEKKIK